MPTPLPVRNYPYIKTENNIWLCWSNPHSLVVNQICSTIIKQSKYSPQYTELQHPKVSQDLRPFAFVKNKELKRHELIHSDVNQYRCPKCSASFKTKPYLYYQRCSGQFKCDECPAAFLWQSSLSRHKNNHKQYQCEHCLLTFTEASSWQSHLLTHNTPSFKPFVCQNCFTVFPKMFQLVRQ